MQHKTPEIDQQSRETFMENTDSNTPSHSISSLLNHSNGQESPSKEDEEVNKSDEKALRACDVCNKRVIIHFSFISHLNKYCIES